MHGLRRCSLEHPITDRDDKTGIFRQRDEIRRRNQAALRMMPAYQSFCLADPPAGKVDDGLVIQFKLAALLRMLQFLEQLAAPLRLQLHGQGKMPVLVAPAILGTVHGQVGILQQLGHIAAIMRV